MSKRRQLRRGTTAENNAFTGAVGEVTVDTTNNTLRVHDGTTVGGTALVKVSQLPTSASATTQGLIEIATQAEVNAGTDNTRAIVPNTLLEGMKTHLSATGSAPIYACRAWVNFNGTGTVATRANGNVSSITDNGTGDYTINFINPMPDNNYAVSYSASYAGSGGQLAVRLLNLSTNSVNVRQTEVTGLNTYSPSDAEIVTVAIFR